MSNVYDAAAIEVLTGLEPVRKRPGMYTDTTRPNHLAQEVIDNSVDEAIAGHAKRIEVTLYKDGSLEVRDRADGHDPQLGQVGCNDLRLLGRGTSVLDPIPDLDQRRQRYVGLQQVPERVVD